MIEIIQSKVPMFLELITICHAMHSGKSSRTQIIKNTIRFSTYTKESKKSKEKQL